MFKFFLYMNVWVFCCLFFLECGVYFIFFILIIIIIFFFLLVLYEMLLCCWCVEFLLFYSELFSLVLWREVFWEKWSMYFVFFVYFYVYGFVKYEIVLVMNCVEWYVVWNGYGVEWFYLSIIVLMLSVWVGLWYLRDVFFF